MALVTTSDAWRGYSLAKESAFGTAATVDTSMNFSGDFMSADPEKVWDDKDENTGELAPTRVQVLTMKTSGKHSSNLTPHSAALGFSWLFGNCTTSNPAVQDHAASRVHKIVTDKDEIEMATRTVTECAGGVVTDYAGCSLADVTVSAAREDFAKIEWTILGMGKEATSSLHAIDRPATVAEDYLTYGDVHIMRGGTYNGTVVSGGTDISARVRDVKVGASYGTKQHYLFGDATRCAGRAIRARMPEFTLEMSLEFEDGAEKAALLAGTTYVVEIPMIGGALSAASGDDYTVRFVFPKVAYNKASRAVDDGLLLLNAGFRVLADATYGPMHVHVRNEQASYL